MITRKGNSSPIKPPSPSNSESLASRRHRAQTHLIRRVPAAERYGAQRMEWTIDAMLSFADAERQRT